MANRNRNPDIDRQIMALYHAGYLLKDICRAVNRAEPNVVRCIKLHGGPTRKPRVPAELKIVAARRAGMTYAEISSAAGVSAATIYRVSKAAGV